MASGRSFWYGQWVCWSTLERNAVWDGWVWKILQLHWLASQIESGATYMNPAKCDEVVRVLEFNNFFIIFNIAGIRFSKLIWNEHVSYMPSVLLLEKHAEEFVYLRICSINKLTGLPQRMPQVSMFFSVFNWTLSKNSWARLLGTQTIFKPEFPSEGFRLRSNVGILLKLTSDYKIYMHKSYTTFGLTFTLSELEERNFQSCNF